ncbi:hypothetical protein DVVG_00026 [Dunaliella viridis virus SI2]|uniref:hypothetical protein n=1 Tax=Dunaliella viridis virus SI2 TaxID=754069 RepID=UPI0002C14CE7|nr:hypothetical protein DVVG_00026 [Dunaliella viridis virus SI2]AGH16012.1 hypothetical protein DVVG_00026 [Dunaliella viridis virus SI2]
MALGFPVTPSTRIVQPPSGCPRDRGAMDRYYGMPYRPHKYVDRHGSPHNIIGGHRVEALTPKELREYRAGWDAQEDRKDWG